LVNRWFFFALSYSIFDAVRQPSGGGGSALAAAVSNDSAPARTIHNPERRNRY